MVFSFRKPDNPYFSAQVTAIHPVGDGRYIAVDYETVLPLVRFILRGGDMKPYEFPTEGTTVMAGKGANLVSL